MKIAALILAAGNSSRMGEAKQLLPWSNTTLLGNAIEVAHRASVSKVFVVLGAEAVRIQKALFSHSYEVIINQHWQQGLGSSISAGISGILHSGIKPNGILIMLADQPFIDAAYINLMIAHFEAKEGRIISTGYGSKMGVPAIFHNCFFDALQNLKGDEGASSLILRNKDICLSLDPGKKTTDLDTPEDYITFKALNSKNET